MSQSFGYFDAATNADVLQRLAAALCASGRLILDLWNPEFFDTHQGSRILQMSSGAVRETKRVERDRLFVELEYPDSFRERFEWQLFTAERMSSAAHAAGLSLMLACTNFDAATAPSAANPRVQFVLDRSEHRLKRTMSQR